MQPSGLHMPQSESSGTAIGVVWLAGAKLAPRLFKITHSEARYLFVVHIRDGINTCRLAKHTTGSPVNVIMVTAMLYISFQLSSCS